MNIYEKEESILRIKEEIPNFNEQELLEYTKIVIPNIHTFASHEKWDRVKRYCSDELIGKIQNNKEVYRISNNMDIVRVGYARVEGFSIEESKLLLKVYSSVFFYDDVDNNDDNDGNFDKYWNDIWVVTYEGKENIANMNKCQNCGASMDYNTSKHMFTCNYCRNSLYYSQINWKIVDVNVNKINYI